MDGIAISWLARGMLFAVASGVWAVYAMGRPRYWMWAAGFTVSIYTAFVHFWSIIERPTQPTEAGQGFSTPLVIAQGLNWGLIGALLIVAGAHAIHIRKVRNGTYAKLAAAVADYEEETEARA